MDLNDARDLYSGQSCFLICDGPSFAHIDKEAISKSGIVTMGVNNSPASYRPNLWCAVDAPVTFLDSVKTDPRILKFAPSAYRKKYSSPVISFGTNTDFNPNRFLSESQVCYGGNDGGRSVMMAALKVLYVLGFKNIFLLGVDFKMEKGAANYHFEQETSDHMVRTNNVSYGKLSNRFSKLKDIFEDNDFNIFNCNPESNLTVFEYLSFEDALIKGQLGIADCENETTRGMYDHQIARDREGRKIASGDIGGRVGRRRGKRKRRENSGKTEVVTQILVSGLSRSGTHAVSNWICSQKTGNVQFRNDLIFSGGKVINPERKGIHERFYTLPSLPYVNGSANAKIDCMVYTYENSMKKTLSFCDSISAQNGIKIQLLRDPYNLVASLKASVDKGHRFWFWNNCTKKGVIDDALMYNFSNAWIRHAKIFLNDSDCVPISYNKWFESNEYRDEVASILNLENRNDDAMSQVPVNGGGSSFDRLEKIGKAEEMKTLDRWKNYKDEDWFIALYKNHTEMRELSDLIFGRIVDL